MDASHHLYWRARHLHEACRLFMVDLVESLPAAARVEAENATGLTLHVHQPAGAAAIELHGSRPVGTAKLASIALQCDHIRSCECPQCLDELEQLFPGFGEFAKAIPSPELQPAAPK